MLLECVLYLSTSCQVHFFLFYSVPPPADFKLGCNFNHKAKSWLVIWEAGVIIEIPPWVLVLYPSSLFFHFNVDIDRTS
jgi:hypothetical protein